MDRSKKRLQRAIGMMLPAAVVVAACGDDGDDAAGRPSPTPAPTGAATASRPAPALATCTNNQIGYTAAYPDDWHTNSGDVAPACTYFDQEPVTLEEGTEPTTAIAFSRDDIAYQAASSPENFGRVHSRDSAMIDGRQAVAILEEASGQGMLEEGTLSYTWLIDLADGALTASTHDESGRPFQEVMDTLDLMISNLDITAPAPEEDGTTPTPGQTDEADQDGDGADPDESTVVAQHEIDGQSFTVVATSTDGELCLTARTDGSAGDPACWSGEPGELTVRALDVPSAPDAIGGFAQPHLVRVLAGMDDQRTVGFRPSDVAGTDLDAWALPVRQAATHHVIGYTADGEMAAMRTPQGDPTSVLDEVNTRPEHTEAAGDVRLLTEVESGLHAGYDRVAFRFRSDIPGYDVSYTQRPIEEAGSGRSVEIEGNAVIEVRMEPASGRERTGDGDPAYTGPERLRGAGTYAITEIVRTGDFEGILTWAIGVQAELPMRVQEFGDVLVVDVRHPET